jgi:cyanate permease
MDERIESKPRGWRNVLFVAVALVAVIGLGVAVGPRSSLWGILAAIGAGLVFLLVLEIIRSAWASLTSRDRD